MNVIMAPQHIDCEQLIGDIRMVKSDDCMVIEFAPDPETDWSMLEWGPGEPTSEFTSLIPAMQVWSFLTGESNSWNEGWSLDAKAKRLIDRIVEGW